MNKTTTPEQVTSMVTKAANYANAIAQTLPSIVDLDMSMGDSKKLSAVLLRNLAQHGAAWRDYHNGSGWPAPVDGTGATWGRIR